jgi:signal peptidase I
MTKQRNIFIAFLFSLFTPGLGQVYNGQFRKALIFIGLLLIFPILWGLIRGTTHFYGFVTLMIIQITIQISIIVDAITNAKRQKEYLLKKYNTWYYYLLYAILIVAGILIMDINAIIGTKTFKIPTNSNQPTIQVGDRIVADLRAYTNKQPDYGDIVVFIRDDGQTYTYRIVGLPFDTIKFLKNNLIINKDTCMMKFVREFNPDRNSGQSKLNEFEEVLPNGHSHKMYISQNQNDNIKPKEKDILVPSNSYYLLGDSRDYAMDSRYIGYVKKEKIVGQVVYCLRGRTFDRFNINLRNK